MLTLQQLTTTLKWENSYIELLANFIRNHAKPLCGVILVDPGRGRKNRLSRLMIDDGFDYQFNKPAHTHYFEIEFKGHVLKFSHS